jgi:signal transduction histidine kinase
VIQAHDGAIERIALLPTATLPPTADDKEIAYSPSAAAFLAHASKRLAGSLDRDVTLQTMAELGLPRLGDACIVCSVPDIQIIARHRDPEFQHTLDCLEAPCGARSWRAVLSVAHGQQTAVLSQVHTNLLLADASPAARAVRDLSLRSAVLVPVIGSLKTLAVVIWLSERRRAYARQVGLAEELASRFALALEAAEMYRQSESARAEAEEAHAETLATAIHDLLSPLTYIKASAQRLHSDPAANDDFRRRLEGIDSATMRVASGLRRVLHTLHPAPDTRRPPERAPTDLVTVVDRVVADQQAIDPMHCIVMVESPPHLLGVWDADELERLVGNLIGNAAKYSPAETNIDVHLRGEQDADGAWAVLQVRDRGLGIPARDLPFVFEPFQRGSNVGAVVGTGLGLASVWQTVKLHDGRLWVESEEGKGTRITVRLPLMPSSTSTVN